MLTYFKKKEMMRPILSRYALLLIVLVACQSQEFEELNQLIELDDDSFEHLTQASSGATTGDWLILMTKDKECSTCSLIEKQLLKIATLKKGFMNVAKLITKDSPLTMQRFAVTKQPVLVFFRLGMQWTYAGPMEESKIVQFISGGYTQHKGKKVIKPLDWMDLWKEDFLTEFEASFNERRLPKNNVLIILLGGGLSLFMVVLGCLSSKKVTKEIKEGKKKAKKEQ